jgi:hypothetical protein
MAVTTTSHVTIDMSAHYDGRPTPTDLERSVGFATIAGAIAKRTGCPVLTQDDSTLQIMGALDFTDDGVLNDDALDAHLVDLAHDLCEQHPGLIFDGLEVHSTRTSTADADAVRAA